MRTRASILALAASLTVALTATAGLAQDDAWTFTGIDRIELHGVSGDLTVESAGGDRVELTLRADVRPADAFTPEVRQEDGTLRIDEDWGHGHSSGNIRWTLSIPESLTPTIVVDTASGGLEMAGVVARVDFDSASGDVRIRSATILAGSSFDTASGDLDLSDVDVQDDVEMDTASGDVRVRDVALEGPGRFSSASGSVVLRLTDVPRFDLEASSASGDVELESPFGADFTLVMTRRADRGSIRSPFAYASERSFERHGQRYVERRVEKGSGAPEIRLSTASGSVVVHRES